MRYQTLATGREHYLTNFETRPHGSGDPFHVLAGGRRGRFSLDVDAGKWPAERDTPRDLSLVGARPLKPRQGWEDQQRMPGVEKRLAVYPQLYSRIGFAHQYRSLTDDELAFVLNRHWKRLGLTLDLEDFTDAQAVAAVSRITRGNFRLLHRLFTQIERVLKINGLSVITNDVIEAARSTLVIGAE